MRVPAYCFHIRGYPRVPAGIYKNILKNKYLTIISALFNKLTFFDWFMKNKQNKQIINLNCRMPSILFLIPSFDNKHSINVIVYIRFDIYAQFQRKEREECQGV